MLISLTFILIISSENIFLYYQLEDKLYKQVDDLMNTTLYAFGRTLDNVFYHAENAGKIYRTYLINSVKNNTFSATCQEFTSQFLYARTNVVSLAVLAVDGAPFESYQYISHPDETTTIYAVHNHNNHKYQSVLQFCKQYQDSIISPF